MKPTLPLISQALTSEQLRKRVLAQRAAERDHEKRTRRCPVCGWVLENGYSERTAIHALQTHMRKHRQNGKAAKP
jgi:hypothetical protein